jgi:hypothetical protein
MNNNPLKKDKCKGGKTQKEHRGNQIEIGGKNQQINKRKWESNNLLKSPLVALGKEIRENMLTCLQIH